MKIRYLLFTSVIFVFFSCQQESREESVKPIPVKTAKVVKQRLSIPIYRSGIIASSSEARLSFKIGGIVERIYVDEGDKVQKGQMLATLNLSEISAQVNLARSSFEKARRDLKRIDKLYRDSVATLEQRQDLQTALDVAAANLEIADFNFKHAKIFAPSNGRILKRFIEENELIGSGTPVFYFGSSDENWIVRLGLTDRDIIRIQPGDSASLQFDAYRDIHFPAVVSELSESVDPSSGTFEVELNLKDPSRKLVSGFVARATIFPSKQSEHILIPVEALVEADKTTGYVFTVKKAGDGVDKAVIGLGQIVGDHIIVTSGLDTNQRIITEGAPYLSGKSTIKIVN